MSQNIQPYPTISDESPNGVSWFFDRTGDPSILENHIPDANLRIHLTNTILRNSIINRNLNVTGFAGNIIKQKINIIIDKNIKISEEQRECCICMDKKNKKDICSLNCSHTLCVTCCNNIIESKQKDSDELNLTCPLCRTQTTTIYVENEESKKKFSFHV
jgi:hypothetical protein